MALVDSRIRVWWTEEKAWYAGRVVSSGRGLHTIAYDDDHSLTHDLLKVTWEAEPVRKRKAEAKAEAPKKRAKKQPPAREQAAPAPKQAEAPPPPPPTMTRPLPTTTKHAYAVGQQVEARHQAQRVGSFASKWFGGVVRKVHADGACDIEYDDGDDEECVPLRFLVRVRVRVRVSGGT
tara:strand:+ start:202 stop:735 length:534 start_codon:yes stop_codon:yes gene_type:complete